MTVANCPQCGRPLTKERDKNKYWCENERCPVVFVRCATLPFKRKVVFDSSVKESTIRKIHEANAYEIGVARRNLLSAVQSS
jgi:ribosomal protein L37AE/L43A